MSAIEEVRAWWVLDSRGTPTVKARVRTRRGEGEAAVPSGASTGSFEALELRDGGQAFGGKHVTRAVKNVREAIAPKVKGIEASDQQAVDEALRALDGTPNKARLGANAVLAVSMACARAAAREEGVPLYGHLNRLAGKPSLRLPVPQCNLLNGGKHAGLEHDIQEYMVAPLKASSFARAIQIAAEIYQVLKKDLKKSFGARAALLGDEGGFVPPVDEPRERLTLLQKAVEEAGYGDELRLALDCASSEFFNADSTTYTLGDLTCTAGELVDIYRELADAFPIYSIEDGMAEEDWLGWQELYRAMGGRLQLVGDDNLVTNVERIRKAVSLKTCNALLLKVNQIGTVTEALQAARLAKDNGWRVVVSHRSGETEDAFIADLAVALGCGQAKMGAPARSERTAKYNRLLEIEAETGAPYGLP